jgi:hypothetical protein
LLGSDAACIEEGLLTEDDILFGVTVAVTVLDDTILFWVAAPLEIE